MIDISLKNFDISVKGNTLLSSADLKISSGNKYGLIGHNGVGKSTLLNHLVNRILPVPPSIDMILCDQEFTCTTNIDVPVYQLILDSNSQRVHTLAKFQKLESLINEGNDEVVEEYQAVCQEMRLNRYDKDEALVKKILNKLGVDNCDRPLKTFSGGWRMIISLARGLYLKPSLLLLDEPTNHLDFEAIVWLIEYINKEFTNTLIVVSHDKNFVNKICTNIIHWENKTLTQYKGNYDSFLKGYDQHRIELQKRRKKVEDTVKDMRNKSKPKKEVDEYIKKNERYKLGKPYMVKIKFGPSTLIKSPIMQLDNVSFGYGENSLFSRINLTINLDSRYILLGRNGVGKSSLMKLLTRELKPLQGNIFFNDRAKIGVYNQHLPETLPHDRSPIEFIVSQGYKDKDIRKYLGNVGLEGKLHNNEIATLSGGQKARVIFALLTMQNPHLLLLDEPTNHLDIETIDSLISAINSFDGGVFIITHNIELIMKTKSKLLILEHGDIKEKNFDDYYNEKLGEL